MATTAHVFPIFRSVFWRSDSVAGLGGGGVGHLTGDLTLGRPGGCLIGGTGRGRAGREKWGRRSWWGRQDRGAVMPVQAGSLWQ